MPSGNGKNRASSSPNRSGGRSASNANSMTRQIAQGKSARQIEAERARQARAQSQPSASRQTKNRSSSQQTRSSGSNRPPTNPSNSVQRPPGRSGSNPPKKKRAHRAGLLSWILALAATGGVAFFLWQLITINILPSTMLVGVCGILVVVLCLLLMLWLFRSRRTVSRVLLGTMVCLIGAACGLGGYFLQSTDTMFADVTNLADRQANVLAVYAMKETGITRPDELKAGMVVGIDPADDGQGTQATIDQLKSEGAQFETKTYDNAYTLVDALYAHEVDAIIFPEIKHAELYEQANDDNKYNALTTFTNVIDQYVYYTDRPQETINPANPVANIMSDPFTVLVSGNDSYGTINQVTRSDVNMLVSVNPKTAQVLILSIPRDAYVEITCKKNQNACAAVAGEPDKLTHSGLYGVGTTESTLEDAFGIDINYYVRINFSSLINIIDAIGGVDVNVEPGLEVERFYANGTEGVHAGMNHLDGERALAFVRERHAYVDGDNQRIKNQQIVLRALLKALLSPKMVVNYPKVMTALSTAFDTNMTAQEMKSLLTLELSRFPKWNIQTYSLAGTPTTDYSPSAQTMLSVMVLSPESVEEVHTLIDDVLAGRTLNLEEAPAPVPQETVPAESYVDSDPVITPYSTQDDLYSIQEDPYDPALSDPASPVEDPYGQDSYSYGDPYSSHTPGDSFTSPYEHPDPYGSQPSAPGLYPDASTYGHDDTATQGLPADPYGTQDNPYGASDYGYGY